MMPEETGQQTAGEAARKPAAPAAGTTDRGPDAESPSPQPPGPPPHVNPLTPNVARMYDYFLGGNNSYPIDRETAERVLTQFPTLRIITRENRHTLIRVVQYLAAEEGVRQFIDIGSGLPTQRNVHEAAREVAPGARTVYVDYDPVVCLQAEALLADDPLTGVIEADLRDPDGILQHPVTSQLIDFERPVAVLLMAILHFIPDSDDPQGAVSRLVERLAPGSYLALSHASQEQQRDAGAREAAGEYRRATAQMVFRSRDQVTEFFRGLQFVEPGLVGIADWRNPEPPAAENATALLDTGFIGVARKA